MRGLVRIPTVVAMAAALGCTPSVHHDSSQSPPSASVSARIAIRPVSTATWPPHSSDAWRLSKIAVDRLGGSHAASGPHVTGVSIAGGYGLAVYTIGNAPQECLFLKENGAWRVLGADAFVPNGRGLLHFGLAPALAKSLIDGLRSPPPS